MKQAGDSARAHLLVVITPMSSKGGTVRRLGLWLRILPALGPMEVLAGSLEPQKLARKLEELLEGFEQGGAKLEISERLAERSNRITVLPAAIQVFAKLARTRPRFLLSNFMWADVACTIAVKAARLAGVKIEKHIIYLAGLPVPKNDEGTWKHRPYSLLARWSIESADEVIVLSNELAREVWTKFGIPDERSFVSCPIGVELPSELTSEKVELTRPGEIVFGVVSRLDPEKRIQDVIEAFDVVAASNPKVRLLIWGDGPYAAQLETIAVEAAHGDRIELRGWIEKPYEAFRQIDCLVLVSSAEGIPRSILEAGLMGVPTIATRVGGVPDVVDDGNSGWLIGVGDVKALVQVMDELVTSPAKLVEAGVNARKKIGTEYSLQREMDSLRSVLS